MRFRPGALLGVAMLMAAPAFAAEINVEKSPDVSVISISGKIGLDDDDAFEAVARSVSGITVVVLNSNGGSMPASVNIGSSIRRHGYGTAVAGNAVCASACGLIWLAGAPRFASGTASIGFHAVFTGIGEDAKESGMGNALVGAYLNKLGLSYEAIAFLTSAAPDDMNWLHGGEAARLGIGYERLPDPKPQTARTVPSAGRQAVPAGSPAERQAMGLVLSYYAAWSRPGADANSLALYYGDRVSFYGAMVPRAKVLQEKWTFSQRWPVRTYTIQSGTLNAGCSDICTVTGVVQWETSSQERNVRSLGTASFVVVVALSGSAIGGTIVSENGAVLSGHKEPLHGAGQSTDGTTAAGPPDFSATDAASAARIESSTTAGYAEGHQARLNYEQWFAALPEGFYREGVLFWVNNRSLKPSPACAWQGGDEAWQQGCIEGRRRLATIDFRRKTDKDFWWGWNSL